MQQLNQEDINAQHPRAPLSLPASVVVQLYCQQFAGWLTNRKPDIQQFHNVSSYFICLQKVQQLWVSFTKENANPWGQLLRGNTGRLGLCFKQLLLLLQVGHIQSALLCAS